VSIEGNKYIAVRERQRLGYYGRSGNTVHESSANNGERIYEIICVAR